VQTGGFGDPNGLKPSDNSKPNGKLIASAAGSFDMPIGAGQGNGSGGAKGIKGTVASADFGSGVATGGHGDGRAGGRGVQTSGFGSQEVAQNTPHVQRMDSGPASTPVEITSKPNPIYTEEARNLKLEGEVLLEVEFAANGQLHVNRVVRGLGHGLDEAAVAAANKMRFKPAQRSGQAIDSTAIVHVVFQLAY
jgi:TonB family protein